MHGRRDKKKSNNMASPGKIYPYYVINVVNCTIVWSLLRLSYKLLNAYRHKVTTHEVCQFIHDCW